MKVLVAQLCPTFCNPMDCSLPDSSVHRIGVGIQALLQKVKVKFTQLCLSLSDPMDYAVLGILQARTLEWVAFPICRGSSQPRDRTQVSHIAGGFFTSQDGLYQIRVEKSSAYSDNVAVLSLPTVEEHFPTDQTC